MHFVDLTVVWVLCLILGVKLPKGGSLTIGGGDHNLNFQRIHHAMTGAYGDSEGLDMGSRD